MVKALTGLHNHSIIIVNSIKGYDHKYLTSSPFHKIIGHEVFFTYMATVANV